MRIFTWTGWGWVVPQLGMVTQMEDLELKIMTFPYFPMMIQILHQGNSTLIEAKCNLDDQKLMQLVTTTVVASFVEKNLHRDLMDVIPTLMIGPTSAIICIYDVKQDYVLMY